jgi:molybdenum cofactor cytidylyltransferase
MDGVLLAAGFSSRAGDFKLAWRIGDRPLIACQVDLFQPFCEKIIVVAGFRIELIRKLLESNSQVQIVENKDFQKGMFSSIQVGVAQVSNDFYICPADYPAILPTTIQKLNNSQGKIRIPVYQKRKGHPVYFEKECKEGILDEKQDSSLRDYIARIGFTTVEVDDPGILQDIDTKEDYKRILGK